MARKKNGTEALAGDLDRQAGSGLSVREFCAQAGVSQASFYAWRRKLRRERGRRKGDAEGEHPRRGVRQWRPCSFP